MIIDFYYAPGSAPCRAVRLVAKALGIDLNHKVLDLNKQHLTPEFLKINPQHTVPTVVDNGFALWESSAILTYLAQQYGKNDSLYPKDVKKRAVVDQMLYFNIGTLLARFGDYYKPVMFANATPDPAKYEKVKEAFKFLDTFLEGQEYVAGNCLTVADIAIVAAVATFDVAKFDVSEYKNVAKWYSKMQKSVPGYDEINGKDTLTKIFEKFLKKSSFIFLC